MSREALSLEISNLVARVLRGETIDIPQTGAGLAAKYPDLGMSGALIGQAIERAAGMVGMIRSTPAPTKRTPRAAEMVAASAGDPPPPNGHAFTEPPVEEKRHFEAKRPAVEPAVTSIPPRARSIDDDLAAAIDAGRQPCLGAESGEADCCRGTAPRRLDHRSCPAPVMA